MKLPFSLPKAPENLVAGVAKNFTNRVRGALGVLMLDADDVMSPALMLEAWSAKTPGKPFVLFEGTAISYGEMRARVARRAAAFRGDGLRWGDVVAIVMHNHPEYLVDVLALSWIGATASLVNTSLSGAGLKHALLQTRPKALVAGAEHAGLVDEALADEGVDLPRYFAEIRPGAEAPKELGTRSRWRRLDELDHAYEAEPTRPPARTLGGELFAYIFTSGTTGLPKAGKILNARAATSGLGFGLFTLGLGEDDVMYVCLPLFHASGLLVGATSVLSAGGTLALSRKLSVSRFWDDVCDAKATCFVYIGEICRYLVGAPPHPRERAHRLRCMVGNGMRPDVWPKFVERFAPGMVHEFYGATEGNINMTNLLGIEGSVGRMPPIPGMNNAFLARFDPDTEMPMRDARGRCIPCRVDEPGELLGRIDTKYVTSRFDGYLADDATSAKILRDVVKKGDAYFRSGDLMRKDLWGFYYFVDRIGDTFRWKGENVATNEVQDALGRFPAVESANVYGVTVPKADGRAGMAALALKPGAHFSPEPFYEHAVSSLPPYAVPAFVRLLSAAEMTATFKLKKTDLQREGYDPRKTPDLIFYRDDRRRSYEPVDAEVFAKIERAEIRF
jgi:fatty-acyl-CoA synthase